MAITRAKKRHPARRGRDAFSFVELLIVMVVLFILGGAVVSALWVMFGMMGQTSDYIAGREEMEFVAQQIGREISNAGLGMPNNRRREGSFAESFYAPTGQSDGPIMARMGAKDQAWGGPVTVAASGGAMVTTLTGDVYRGPELYYAWGVPTGVKAAVKGLTGKGETKTRDSDLTLEIQPYSASVNGLSILTSLDIVAATPSDPLSWILFPTSRMPLLITGIDTGNNELTVKVAPGYFASPDIKVAFMGMDDVYLPRAARISLNARGQVVQNVYGPGTSTQENILANNIVGLHFAYDPEMRVLTMHIAARGDETDSYSKPGSAAAADWQTLTGAALPGISRNFRLLINRMQWRIRN